MLKQQISLPELKLQNSTTSHFYTHIYRQGGFRIQQEDVKDKHIFHNYGQGDAEYSLSYGSAYIISKIITVKQDASKIKQVAVLGHGINAFMTSLELLKRGYKVTLYCSKTPIKKKPDSTTKTVDPQQGLQIWYPGGYDNCDPLKHQLLAKLSFEFYKQCLHANRYQSLKQVTCYLNSVKQDELKQHVTDYINSDIKSTHVVFGNQIVEEFVAYKTILIDTRLFMEQIFTQLKLRNISIVEKEFKSMQQIMDLKEKYLFNCLSKECKTLFQDNNVQITQGCFLVVQSQMQSKPQSSAVWIGSQVQNGTDYIITWNKKKIQVNTKSTGVHTIQQLKQINDKTLAWAYHYLKQRTVKPYKL